MGEKEAEWRRREDCSSHDEQSIKLPLSPMTRQLGGAGEARQCHHRREEQEGQSHRIARGTGHISDRSMEQLRKEGGGGRGRWRRERVTREPDV